MTALKTLILAALLLPLLAMAQPDAAAPPCPSWEGAGLTVRMGGGAACAKWACKPADRYGRWALAESCIGNPLTVGLSNIAALEKAHQAKDFAALLAARTHPVEDPMFAEALAATRAAFSVPPGPWTVAKNGTTTTRPTRILESPAPDTYTLGAASTERADVGSTCYCQFRAVVGTATWCAVKKNLAAICTDK